MNLNYESPSAQEIYQRKADRICELYAVKLRMTGHLRAIVTRYNFPNTDNDWTVLQQTVAGHAFIMAQLIGPLYLEFLDFFADKNISLPELESEALHHDDAEALTGDAATDVDGITRAMKDAAEAKSIDRQYCDLVCQSYMRTCHKAYEAKDSYASKIVKTLDALELISYSQACVRNGVGMIYKKEYDGQEQYYLEAFGELRPVDRRTYGEIAPYFADGTRDSLPISEIMYDHSLPRLGKLGQPELVELFKLLCSRVFVFPFEQYNEQNLPMDFARMQ